MNTFKATQKFVKITPKKVRPVVAMIKKMSPVEAVKILPFIGKGAALPLAKVIKTALANAKQKDVDGSDLVFAEIQIGEGPRLKRGIPVSRGQWHPILKRMSHITVVLAQKEKPAAKKEVAEKKEEKKPEVKEVKKTVKKTTKKEIKK
jgi:large subunit ribosomal protein L22